MRRAKSPSPRPTVPKIPALLVVDRDFAPVARTLLENARASIEILAFSFAGSGGGRKPGGPNAADSIERLLIRRKTQLGDRLRIRLYVESARETAGRNRLTAERLRAAGVEVRYGATHAKGFRIDGRYVLLGSTNLTHQSIAKNHESNLLFDVPAVAREFGRYFAHAWAGGGHGGIRLKPPLLADGDFRDAVVRLIDRARDQLHFSIYFFEEPAIEAALLRAHARGVAITGLVHDHATFALSFVRRSRATVGRLRAAGLRQIHFGPRHLFTHSKWIVGDGEQILLGTANWLEQDVRIHPQLSVRFANAEIGRELAEYLRSVIPGPPG